MIQQDLFAAIAAREAGIEAVSVKAAEWFPIAINAIAEIPVGWRGTGEDIRVALHGVVAQPHHHNAWGALIRTAVIRKILRPTGEMTNMRTAKSHARRTSVYVRI